jgi:hypothetical protein
MGRGSWDANARTTYASLSAMRSTKSVREVFKNRVAKDDYNSKNIKVRESLDSEDNPESTPIMIALDVTGSMGFIPSYMANKGLGTLASSIMDDSPVKDPHLMMMAIGDIRHDSYPIQATQFEADIRIAEQITDLYLESGGGGNATESYDLAWIFANQKTKTDSFKKRGIKGYLFTIGDELPPSSCPKENLIRHGFHAQDDILAKDSLEQAQKEWHVFHICVEETGHRGKYKEWKECLGNRAIRLSNHEKISEVITSVIRVSEGESPQDVINSFKDEETQSVVSYALGV